jgi:hypothetical protein
MVAIRHDHPRTRTVIRVEDAGLRSGRRGGISETRRQRDEIHGLVRSE